MNQILAGLVLITSAGALGAEAQGATIQWATGCASRERSDVISLSYDTQSKQITLYRTLPSAHGHPVTRFFADRLAEDSFSEPTIFKAYFGDDGVVELPVIFETKATMFVVEGSERIRYTCDFYSFDRD